MEKKRTVNARYSVAVRSFDAFCRSRVFCQSRFYTRFFWKTSQNTVWEKTSRRRLEAIRFKVFKMLWKFYEHILIRLNLNLIREYSNFLQEIIKCHDFLTLQILLNRVDPKTRQLKITFNLNNLHNFPWSSLIRLVPLSVTAMFVARIIETSVLTYRYSALRSRATTV